MSLKLFHVFFIALSVLCTLGFAAWTVLAEDIGSLVKASGVGSGVLGLALAGYGYWFVTRKSKRLIT